MSDERNAALAKFLKQRRGYLVDIESFNAGWQAAIQAERERCAKIAQKRANVLFELAGKESIGPLMIALKTAADELKRVVAAIREVEE